MTAKCSNFARMKIQYASDLHTEFGANGQYLNFGQPLRPVGDVLILAGDIDYYVPDYVSEEGDFWEYLSIFRQTFR